MKLWLAALGLVAIAVLGVVLWPAVPAPQDGPAEARSRPAVWADEFDGPWGTPPHSSRWTLREGGAWGGGRELQAYTERPANVALDGRGHLRIVARREVFTGPDGISREFTSARLDTEGQYSFSHGRVEARIKLPAGRGLLPAFWLLGQRTHEVGWPAGGEIDVVELLGQAPRVAHGSLHVPSSNVRGVRRLAGTYRARGNLTSGFHRYAIHWRPGRIDFLLDGRRYGSFRRSDLRPGEQWVFEEPFHFVLNLAVGNPWTGPPDASTKFPAVMLVDWIRVYPE
jgi:beta-glucanase (GH16 family)